MTLTITWSSFCYGNSPIAFTPTTAFQTVDRKIYPFQCERRVIENMPRSRTVGAWGLCSAESARVCAQWYMCKVNKVKDCKSISPDEEISPLSMQAWSRATYQDNKLIGSPLLHRNLDLLAYDSTGKPVQAGTYGSEALFNSSKVFTFFPEACYPFDQLASTTKFASYESVVNALTNAEKFFEQNKKKTEGYCEDCFAKEVGSAFGIQFDSARLKTALNTDTFKQFLFELIFYKCKKRVTAPPPTFSLFPDPDDPSTKGKAISGKDIRNKIFEIISESQAPMNLDGLCAFKNVTTGKCEYHHIALSGVDKVCKAKDCKDCRERVQVQNSWGADWQNRYTDDGFVDLESITGNLKNPLDIGTLSWIEDGNNKKK